MTNVATIKVVRQGGTLVQAPGTNAAITTTTLRVTNLDAAILRNQQNAPTIQSGLTDIASYLQAYSNTALMLANDATTYANSVSYANSLVANIHVANLVDVALSSNPPSNNSTLVYNTSNNKYIVQQMNLDGGNY